MKKKLLCTLLLMCCMFIVSCGKNVSLNENNVRVAKRIISATDDFLNGDTSSDEALEIVEEEYYNIDEDDENSTEQVLFGAYALNIQLDLSALSRGSDADIKEITEERNKIAELIGEGKYK